MKSQNKMLVTLFVSLFLLSLFPILSFAQATRESALEAIQQAEQDIQEMVEAGFSISSVNDTLIAARQALERVDFAELIRKDSTGEIAKQAKKALEGLDYEGFTYDEVLKYTNEISERKQKAYEFSDFIRAVEIKTEEYKKQGINISEAENLIKDAKISFEKERYTETETLLSEVNLELENKKAELTTVRIIVRSGKGFIEKNWREILIVTAVIFIFGLFGWRKFRIRRIKNKLKKLRIEQKSLLKLMKKTQEERFNKGKIPGSVYNIRMENYNKRMGDIKENIPVLEAMLKKGKKKKLL